MEILSRYHSLWFLLLSSVVATASGQPAARSYFPLHVGDVWFYGPGEPPEIVAVTDSLRLDGNDYYVYVSSRTGSDTLRVDDTGWRVYRYESGEEQLLYDFAFEDSSYTIDQFYPNEPDPFGYSWTVTVTGDITVSTPLGDFEDCIRFSFDIRQVLDEQQWITFAPGVGIVRHYSVWHSSSVTYANVGGTTVRVAADDTRPVSTDVKIFPNPATDEITIELALPAPGQVALSFYDMLGREVRRPLHIDSGPGPRSVFVDVSELAPAVYLLRIDAPRFTATKRVVVVR